MDEVEAAIPENVDPNRLRVVLKDLGWQNVGGREGIYARYAPPSEAGTLSGAPSVLIPLDQNAVDYPRLMYSALSQLAHRRDFWTRSLYPRLALSSSDEFRFRKESSAPSGLISWRHGERLIECARRTLLAGAKYYLGAERHFVNRHGRFAGRYLDRVMMGQTAPGSYIVTALAPPDDQVSLKPSAEPLSSTWDPGAIRLRTVNEAVAHAVGATVEALEHYRSSGSLAGFESGVVDGISYEMTNAILGIAANADESDITIEWDKASTPPTGVASHFEFLASDVPTLAQAAIRLAEDQSTAQVSITGRVHLLAKKLAGSAGVFGVDSLQSAGPRKVRVRLADDEDYHEAIRAHEEDLAIQVSGRLEKEGNLSWLYDATVIRTLGPLDEYESSRRAHPEVNPDQIEMF
ncbi:hypothetical protein [Streptomyces sp. NBC_00878]|uniref:hypothetical protein n=1 Tax=Streptomyces sp. NBC_00878 TaxID=2975854 RepID=UPI00224FC720|nr:hypothetical protein [Streptomyces sp. NBC_00878]MCX4907055.1 hypothetical protein [Streptomyces sp. NBC_00878]